MEGAPHVPVSFDVQLGSGGRDGRPTGYSDAGAIGLIVRHRPVGSSDEPTAGGGSAPANAPIGSADPPGGVRPSTDAGASDRDAGPGGGDADGGSSGSGRDAGGGGCNVSARGSGSPWTTALLAAFVLLAVRRAHRPLSGALGGILVLAPWRARRTSHARRYTCDEREMGAGLPGGRHEPEVVRGVVAVREAGDVG